MFDALVISTRCGVILELDNRLPVAGEAHAFDQFVVYITYTIRINLIKLLNMKVIKRIAIH